MRQGKIIKRGILTNRQICNKIICKEENFQSELPRGHFRHQGYYLVLLFHKKGHGCPPCAFCLPAPSGGFGGTHSLGLVPVGGELSRGGTSSRTVGEGGKWANVCAGEGKASRFRSVAAKQAVTLR